MAFRQYQVTFNEDGEVIETTLLPEETPRVRTITVRAETSNGAERAAEDLYSIAE